MGELLMTHATLHRIPGQECSGEAGRTDLRGPFGRFTDALGR
jgi:hypothetical protein